MLLPVPLKHLQIPAIKLGGLVGGLAFGYLYYTEQQRSEHNKCMNQLNQALDAHVGAGEGNDVCLGQRGRKAVLA